MVPPTMNIMMHTEFMGFLIGSSEKLLVDGLALELLSKNSMMLFVCLFVVFSLLVNSVKSSTFVLTSITHNREESKIQRQKLDSNIACDHQ